jgi:hypothetical protein
MNGYLEYQSKRNLSVTVISRAVTLLMVNLGILTIFTHLAQIASIPFVYYAYLMFGLLMIISFGMARTIWRDVSRAQTKDWSSLALVMATGILAGFLVIRLQPINSFGGAIYDYYFLANAVYYYYNPSQPFNFIVHSLYSGGGAPFVSASYLTTGAFQYMQAAMAYVLRMDYITFAYLIVSPISGLMFPFSLYLLLTRFTDDSFSAAFGTFTALLIIMWLGERSIAPGVWIFSRVFQGKSIVVSTGVCLFTHYFLNYFDRRAWNDWLRLALFATALLGMSSVAIMILPVAAAIIFMSYFIAYIERPFQNLLVITKLGVVYVAALFYIFLSAASIASMDSAEAATYINREYPSSFGGYVYMFMNSEAPTTPVLIAICSIISIFLTAKNARRFVIAQVFLPFFILNPWVSNLLIKLYRGVYFRMFYFLPLFFVIGLTVSLLFDKTKTLSRNIRAAAWIAALVGIVGVTLLLPTSIMWRLKSFDSKFSGQNYDVAMKAIEMLPPGVVLAPDAISSTMFTFNPAYPQIIIKRENTDYFLWAQNRGEEGKMRAATQIFLLGDPGKSNKNYEAFMELTRKYPEIQAVVFNGELSSKLPDLRKFLRSRGFVNSINQSGYVIAWK